MEQSPSNKKKSHTVVYNVLAHVGISSTTTKFAMIDTKKKYSGKKKTISGSCHIKAINDGMECCKTLKLKWSSKSIYIGMSVICRKKKPKNKSHEFKKSRSRKFKQRNFM